MQKVKILFIHHGVGIGGSPVSLLNIILNLDKSIFACKVLFLKNSEAVDLFRKNDIPLRVLDSHFYRKMYLYFFHSEAGYFKLYDLRRMLKISFSWIFNSLFFAPRVLRQEEADIVYLNSSFLSDWAFAASRLGKKVICHVREPIAKGHFGIRRGFLRWMLERYADKIVAISGDNAKRLDLPEKTEVVYNSVTSDFLQEVTNPSTTAGRNGFDVIYVGGYSFIKGFHVLVKSLGKLNNHVRVFFLGDYPSSDGLNLKRRIKVLFGKDRMLYRSLKIMRDSKNAVEVGTVGDVQQYLQRSSLLVFPSTVAHFARPVIEAMLLRIPVIASDVDGMSEIVADNVNGKLVPPGDSDRLALEINRYAAGCYDTNKMGCNGYEFAIKRFLPSNNKLIERIILGTVRQG